MTLTRIQLITGDSSQGEIIEGEVQGVKQGVGVTISSVGRISFQSTTAEGILRLNNLTAFNSYNWPNVSGSSGTFLSSTGSGGIAWTNSPSIISLGLAPVNPRVGQLWFDYSTDYVNVFQDQGSNESWKNANRGLDPIFSNVTANPTFSSGSGTEEEPFQLASVRSRGGRTLLLPSTITIVGLAPFQYVSIFDINEGDNNYRFQPTSVFADQTGTLVFKISFIDSPQTLPGVAYEAIFRIGFEDPVYLGASVEINDSVEIVDSGSISGSPEVGEVLTYTPGFAIGGVEPYTYTWVWKSQSGLVLQENGTTYVVGPQAYNSTVYVELTATDASSDTASKETGAFPSGSSVIEKGPFPNTTVLFPTTTTGTISTTWLDAGTSLSSDGCIEISTDGVTFSQGPIAITNGGTLTTRWVNSAGCAGASNGSTISGCVFSDLYVECQSLVIGRVPSPFSFSPVTNANPSTATASQVIVPVGYNSLAYVTYNPTSTCTSIQASKDGGTTWLPLGTTGSNSFPLSPGESLRVRGTTGPDLGASYTAIINIGSGVSIQSTTFTITNTLIQPFSTPITFPTTTTSEAASAAWAAGDGPTSLTATGCIEFKVGTGGTWTGDGDPAVAITTGDILYTRWSNSTPGSCGGSTHGSVISGTISNVPSGGTKTSTASLTVDRVPAMFSFTDLTGQATSSVITSATINITGINAPAYITRGTSTLTSIEASVGGGAWTAVPSSGETLAIDPVVSGPGTSLQIRGTTGGSNNTNYTAVINIGQGTSRNTDTWTVRTAPVIPSIVTPSIVTPVNGAIDVNPYSSNPRSITVTSSNYSGINGAGSHVSSDWEVYYLNGSSPVYVVQATNDTIRLTSYQMGTSLLAPNRTYYVRVRYRTNYPSAIVSEWSNVSQFSTPSAYFIPWGSSVDRSSFGPTAMSNTGVGGLAVITGLGADGVVTLVFGGPPTGNSGFLPAPVFNETGRGTYGNGKFFLAGPGVFYESADGKTWSSQSPPAVTPLGIAYSTVSNVICVVGSGGKIFTSSASLISWTERVSPVTSDINSIIWVGSEFKACGGTNFLTSTNGTSWSSKNVNLSLTSGEGRCSAIAFKSFGIGSPYVLTIQYRSSPSGTWGPFSAIYRSTDDGSSWTRVNLPGPVDCVSYSPAQDGWFFAYATGPGAASITYCSLDGLTWVASPLPGGTTPAGGPVRNVITWSGPDRHLAVTYKGSIHGSP